MKSRMYAAFAAFVAALLAGATAIAWLLSMLGGPGDASDWRAAMEMYAVAVVPVALLCCVLFGLAGPAVVRRMRDRRWWAAFGLLLGTVLLAWLLSAPLQAWIVDIIPSRTDTSTGFVEQVNVIYRRFIPVEMVFGLLPMLLMQFLAFRLLARPIPPAGRA